MAWRRRRGHQCLRRGGELCAGVREKKKAKCGGGGKVTAFPPIYSGIRRRFGSDAPTFSTPRDGNGRTTCPTSGCGSFDPITAITTRAVCEEAACVAENYSST